MSWQKNLAISHLDTCLAQIKPLSGVQRPKSGWIKAIRQALGMSSRQLGKRMGLSQPRISLLEKGELVGSVSLHTLEKAANALGCHLVYALVPETSLAELRKEQAKDKAQKLNQYAERHMALENQETEADFQRQTVNDMADKLLREWPRDFWD